MSADVKIGIDVGGTFTHAVAIDALTLRLLGKAKVATTHGASEGVARGVVTSLEELLAATGIAPDRIALIAHSTTQATNALLEGDVAPVGILGMGRGFDRLLARRHTAIADLELAPGKHLRTLHRFLDLGQGLDGTRVLALAEELVAEGARALVVSEAFGIEPGGHESAAALVLREHGLLATAASEIAQIYGLAMRTRTAAINAAMLPIMLATAELTERAVRASGITAPLMIMRSDGGIMDIAEMKRRPILTMLSGPAAGVAAALMYARISDGVFLEVGGTSTDVSVVKNGRAMIRPAEIGGFRLALRTLDVRTLGVGGGSLPRIANGKLVAVGPRSAHIAGLAYVAFTRESLDGAATASLAPRSGDPADYVKLAAADGSGLAFTPTEAALLEAGTADVRVAAAGTLLAAAAGQRDARAFASGFLAVATGPVQRCVEGLLREYRLDKSLVALHGGGGGAGAIVPHTAAALGLPHVITEHADVISAIGAALGMIRESIERSTQDPGEAEILRIRQDAFDAVVRMGAAAESVEVRVEVDSRRRVLLATAQGTPELRARDLGAALPDDAALAKSAAASFPVGTDAPDLVARTAFHRVFRASRTTRGFLGLFRNVRTPIRVLDREGVVRLRLAHADARECPLPDLVARLSELLESATGYGDAGAELPDLFVLAGARILDLTGLTSLEQARALLRVETASLAQDLVAVAIVAPR